MKLILGSAGYLLGQKRACPLVWCCIWRKREKHFHRGKTKFSDFPRLPRGWEPRAGFSDNQRVTRFVLLLYIATSPAKVFYCSPQAHRAWTLSGQFPFFLASFPALGAYYSTSVRGRQAENPEQPMPLPQSPELCSLGAEHVCIQHIHCGPAFKSLYFPKLLEQ